MKPIIKLILGIGIACSNIRSAGSYIRGTNGYSNGHSNGITSNGIANKNMEDKINA